MKTLLIVVGKTADPHLSHLLADYEGRIAHYMPFEEAVVPEPKATRTLSEAQQKNMEGDAIMRLLQPTDHVVLLDSRGLSPTSLELARWLEQKRQAARRLVFIIGGPYGFSEQVYARAQERLSLSRLTFSHQMVRLIFAEQLYRACTILRGEPYHHE